MDYGRVIRVRFRSGETALYVVNAKLLASAIQILKENLELGVEFEAVSHASSKMLASMKVAPGHFKKTTE
jgi:hypothetical protein